MTALSETEIRLLVIGARMSRVDEGPADTASTEVFNCDGTLVAIGGRATVGGRYEIVDGALCSHRQSPDQQSCRRIFRAETGQHFVQYVGSEAPPLAILVQRQLECE